MTHTKVKYLNRVVVLTPQQKLLGGTETEELQEHIERLDEDGNQFLVVNLEKVSHLATAGITALIRGHKSYRSRDSRMVLCCLDEHTLNIFIIMKLVTVFDIYETEEEAIASFAAPPPAVPTA
jgi:anti-sigma B factor antagonist